MCRLSFLFAVATVLGGCAMPLVQEAPFTQLAFKPGPLDWAATLSSPQEIEVTALVTGEIKVPRSILIDLDSPALADQSDREVWVPVVAYLVRHPKHGDILLDSGFDASFSQSGHGNFGGLARFVDIARQQTGQDVVSLLHLAGVEPSDLRLVLLSHAHADHTAGLPALPNSVPVVVGAGGMGSHEVRWYAPTDHFAGRSQVWALSFEGMPDAGYGRSIDLFGDGSLLVIDTSGHAHGNLSVVVNNPGGPILLTFDASHLHEGFDQGVAPGKADDRSSAEESLRRLRALATDFPELRVIAGHDALDWNGRGGLHEVTPDSLEDVRDPTGP